MEFKTQSEYFAEMMDVLREKSGRAMGDHSEPAMRLRVLASELEALGAEAMWIWRQSFPQTADGERLDEFAELRGLKRTEGASASGSVRFFTDGEAEVTVPAGTAVMSTDLSRFETTEAITIPAGSEYGDAAAAAVLPGAAGNVAAGEICIIAEPPVGVIACRNVDAFTGGREGEGDESLRKRLIADYRMASGAANAAYYQRLALSVDGVVKATVYPRAYGPGTLIVYLAGKDGDVPSKVRQDVLKLLNAEREICVTPYILSTNKRYYTPAFKVRIRAGTDRTAITAAAIEKLSPLFGGHTLGEPVYFSDIIRAVNSVEGILGATPTYSQSDVAAEINLMTLLNGVDFTFEEV